MQTSIKIFEQLTLFLASIAQNPEKYCQRPEDFTRKSKLNFSTLISLQLPLLKSLYKAN
jgi:hypothetical protein